MWQTHLAPETAIPGGKIVFSWSSAPDDGIYAALQQGFNTVPAPRDRFMGWLTAGDVLMPGALACVAAASRQFRARELSWLSGAPAELDRGMPLIQASLALPTRAIRAGLCDGTYWPRVHQQGTFFRKWLWESVNPAQALSAHRASGDWALWRAFAQKATLAQVTFPLGANQTASRPDATAQAEIDSVLPLEHRQAGLRDLVSRSVSARQLQLTKSSGGVFRLLDVAVDDAALGQYRKVFGSMPDRKLPSNRQTTQVATGRRLVAAQAAPDWLVDQPGLIGMDADWQFPAITEQHAFAQLSAMNLSIPDGRLYVAYPWATLIDKLQKRTADSKEAMARFEQFCAFLPKGGRKVTVCQHIFAYKYTYLFDKAGIEDVFWSHAARAEAPATGTTQAQVVSSVRFHAFPLYPVQTPEALAAAQVSADDVVRKHLFSFIGAQSNKWYLTQARSWILGYLADDPRGLIVGREKWHYQQVVYDLQVEKTADKDAAAKLVDQTASEMFRDTLQDSTFALCPSGTGPNSIRLWEALAAGSIPVVLADTWAPPGNPKLWDMAVVFCPETPDAVRALPDRLAALAADRDLLVAMRHAMRQLWLLYGPPSFISDVLDFLQTHGDGRSDPVEPSLTELPDPDAAAQTLLVQWSSKLLLDPEPALQKIAQTPRLQDELGLAYRATSAEDVRTHFDTVLTHAQNGQDRICLARNAADTHHTRNCPTPAQTASRAPRVCLFGRHAHRTPLAYAAIRRHIGARIDWADNPQLADLVVTGFDVDFRENQARLAALTASAMGPKLAVISEEPLWDITWSGAPEGRYVHREKNGAALSYAFLSHATSEIFSFDKLPYYIMAEDRFIARYASLIARQARRRPAELLAHWRQAPLRAAFVAEKRAGDKYRCQAPTGRIVQLSGYRGELAEQMQAADVLRMGKGWTNAGTRQDMADWHLDKLAHLHDRCTMISALENVHHGLYISEKIFDAFACGAVPIYFAGPGHRVFDLVPEAAMINAYGLDVAAARSKLDSFTPDLALAEAWLETAHHLTAMFRDHELIEQERARIADAVLAEVSRIVY